MSFRGISLSSIATAVLLSGCTLPAERCYVTLSGAGAPTAEACERDTRLVVRPITETNPAYYVPPYVIGALQYEGYLDDSANRTPAGIKSPSAWRNSSNSDEMSVIKSFGPPSLPIDKASPFVLTDPSSSRPVGGETPFAKTGKKAERRHRGVDERPSRLAIEAAKRRLPQRHTIDGQVEYERPVTFGLPGSPLRPELIL